MSAARRRQAQNRRAGTCRSSSCNRENLLDVLPTDRERIAFGVLEIEQIIAPSHQLRTGHGYPFDGYHSLVLHDQEDAGEG